MVDILPNPTAGQGIDFHADRSHQVIVAAVLLIALPTIAVCLRLLSRWMARAPLWWDDYAVIFAMVFSWGPNISNVIALRYGFGKHIGAPGVDIHTFYKILYIFQIIYVLALVFVKYSIILFLHRIFPIVHFRRILVGWAVFTTLMGTACLLISILECLPPHDFWRSLGGDLPQVGGRCLKIEKFFSASGATSAAVNFILLSMPIPLLWKLKTRTMQKLVLTFIFTVGLVVCVVSIVRLVLLSHSTGPDITWSYVPIAIWTAAEPSIGVVSACLPSLRPLFARAIWGRSYRPKPPYETSDGRSYSWNRNTTLRSDDKGCPSGTFNRLRENSQGDGGDLYPTWTNQWAAYGGKRARATAGDAEDEIGLSEAGDRRSIVPEKGIRVRTTVTVTEKVDWQENLF